MSLYFPFDPDLCTDFFVITFFVVEGEMENLGKGRGSETHSFYSSLLFREYPTPMYTGI